MTNGHEKSDPATVAWKPTNEAGATGRGAGGAKGGDRGKRGPGRSTLRTPSWEGASHGLDRVRRTGSRERKEEKFTANLHHVDVAALEEAFFDLKTDRRAGRRRTDVEGLRSGARAQARGPAFAGSSRSVPGAPRRGAVISLNRMVGSALWRSPPWRTRSSNGRRRPC